jgi:branched-chain amino acid transport system substrate-binding protein
VSWLRILFFLALMLLAATAQAAESPSPQAASSVVVGCVFELTGPRAVDGQAALAGVKLAARKINQAGGVLGRPLRLEVRDAAANMLSLDRLVLDLVQKSNATAFVGLLDATAAQAAGVAAQGLGRLFLCVGATLDGLPESVGPLFFTAAFDDTAEAEALASMAASDLGLDKAVLIVDPSMESWSAFGKKLSESLAARGVQVEARLEMVDDGGDLDALAAEIGSRQGPLLLGLASGGPDAVRAVAALRRAGIDWPAVCGAGMDTANGAPRLGAASGTVYYAAHADYQQPEELVQLFVQDYTEQEGHAPVGGPPALGFDAMALLARAMELAGSSQSEAAAKALSSVSGYRGVTGSFSYGPHQRAPSKPVRILVSRAGSLETAENAAPAPAGAALEKSPDAAAF